MLETFQATHRGGDGRTVGVDPETDDEIVEPELEPEGVEELE
jgi:hypothetical protein